MRLSSIFRRCHQDNTNTLLSKLTVIMHAVQVKTEWWPEAHAGGETAWTIVKVWMCNHGEKCETDKRVKGTSPRGRDESGAEKWWELIWERGQRGNPSNNQTGTNRTGYLNCLEQKWCNSFFLEKTALRLSSWFISTQRPKCLLLHNIVQVWFSARLFRHYVTHQMCVLSQ